MAEQLPIANAREVAGQVAVANHIVLTEVDGFEEDTEARQAANGRHSVDITYSRRKTKTLTMELAHGGDPTLYQEGGHVTASYVPGTPAAWEIRSAQRINTRGPVQIALELVSLTESIPAP